MHYSFALLFQYCSFALLLFHQCYFAKWGFESPLRLLKFQRLITGGQTPYMGVFFISLESYQSVDVKNGFTWAIWTSVAQVMAKKKARSQTDSRPLKSGIDPTPVRASRMWDTVGRLLTRVTSLLETSSQLEV